MDEFLPRPGGLVTAGRAAWSRRVRWELTLALAGVALTGTGLAVEFARRCAEPVNNATAAMALLLGPLVGLVAAGLAVRTVGRDRRAVGAAFLVLGVLPAAVVVFLMARMSTDELLGHSWFYVCD